jgi:hypothetical protein
MMSVVIRRFKLLRAHPAHTEPRAAEAQQQRGAVLLLTVNIRHCCGFALLHAYADQAELQ